MRNNFKTALVTFGLTASAMFSSCIDRRPSSSLAADQKDSIALTDSAESAAEWAEYEAQKETMVQSASQWDVTIEERNHEAVAIVRKHKTENRYIETVYDLEANKMTTTSHDAKNGYKADTLFSMPLDQHMRCLSGDPFKKPTARLGDIMRYDAPSAPVRKGTAPKL